MNESQVTDFFSVLGEDNLTHFCITETPTNECVFSMHGADENQVGGLIVQAMKEDEYIERLLIASVVSYVSNKSKKPRQAGRDLVGMILKIKNQDKE